MVESICLHRVEEDQAADFAASMAALLDLERGEERLREKSYGDDLHARYRETRLRKAGGGSVTVRIRDGILIVRDSITTMQDVVIQFRTGGEKEAERLAEKVLAGEDRYVLADPYLKLRLRAMGGAAYPPADPEEGVKAVMGHYLGWQVYGLSWQWYLLDGNREDPRLVRQTRVKLRRLRSCLVFFKAGLPSDVVYRWQQEFKEDAELLSNMRELDVLLQTCRRYRRCDSTGAVTGDSCAMPEPLLLEGVAEELRQEESAKFYRKFRLNGRTLQLARFLLWLMGSLKWRSAKEHVRDYSERRLAHWADRLENMSRKYTDFREMKDLHKIRIKVKRFRYVVQTLDVVRLDLNLLRRLKQLQDMLGLLHDDYINALWAAGICRKYRKDRALNEETRQFLAWQGSQAQAALALLPGVWQEFLAVLKETVPGK